MHTILTPSEKEIVVEKSRFIGMIFHLESEKDVDAYLSEAKKKHLKAKHFCYAYTIKGKVKCSDDKEPSGSAGRPILGVLLENEIDEVLLIVVRYFGGTLLGKGRLLRSYVTAAKEVLSSSEIIDIEEYFLYSIEIDYNLWDNFKNHANKFAYMLENVDFGNKIILTLLSKDDVEKDLLNLYQGNIKVMFIKKTSRYKRK